MQAPSNTVRTLNHVPLTDVLCNLLETSKGTISLIRVHGPGPPARPFVVCMPGHMETPVII